jgi:hypothetical protein
MASELEMIANDSWYSVTHYQLGLACASDSVVQNLSRHWGGNEYWCQSGVRAGVQQ